MRKTTIVGAWLAPLLVLAGCGGGDEGNPDPSGITYTPGVFEAASLFADRCAVPRTGVDPWTGDRYPDRAGSALHEKHFLRSWTNELYLWYDEVPDSDPASLGGSTGGVLPYFAQLKSMATTATGMAKDRFHFTYDTDEYRRMSSTGTQLGYGIAWEFRSTTPPREVLVRYVQPGSPAALAGITRGARLLRVDGINVVNNITNAGIDTINDGIYPDTVGESHTLEFQDRGSTSTRTPTLLAGDVDFDPVPVVETFEIDGTLVGYLLFNEHTSASEPALRSAVQLLDGYGVNELVLDLRYNGGGYLDIASELAFMIAGPAITNGRTFERLQFNAKHPTRNPVTGALLAPMPFHATTQGFAGPSNQPLPSLDLARVYVLTSSGTCSASEAIINGLRGVGIEVIQIGGDTCGKPYGFYAEDNCGTSYFSIQFRGVNDDGFGDYADGFSSTRTVGNPLANLPGCFASDDLQRELGDVREGQLAVALAHVDTGACPVAPLSKITPLAAPAAGEGAFALRERPRHPWQDNRILR